MKRLIWKKIGWFAEEASARYQAKLSDGSVVNIAKDAYTMEWVADFERSEQEGKDLAATMAFLTRRSLIEHIQKYLS